MSVLRNEDGRASDSPPSPLETRRSIRKYLDKQVSDEVLQQVLLKARWAPSTINSQSTFVYALSGKPFEEFKAELLKRSEDDVPAVSDINIGGPWTPAQEALIQEFRQMRSTWCAAEEKRLGIEPQPAPPNPSVGGAKVHGAPMFLILAFDKVMSRDTGCVDAGLFAMAITLAAQEHGLGTCIVASAVRHSDLMRKYIPGLEDKNVVFGITIGYPDAEAVVNRFPRSRMLPEDYLTYVR